MKINGRIMIRITIIQVMTELNVLFLKIFSRNLYTGWNMNASIADARITVRKGFTIK